MASYTTKNSSIDTDWRNLVEQHVETVGYGSIEIVVHDSRIVHIDTTKRIRLDRQRPDRRLAIADANKRVQLKADGY